MTTVDETPTSPATSELQPTHKVGRAVFLGALAAGVSSLYWGKTAWSRVSSAIGPIESHIPLVPTGGWRIYAVSGSLPGFDPKTWRLEIGGHVEQPTTLDYHQLLALPKVEQVSTFHCVTGWTVKNVQWGGVRLGEVLALAKPTDVAHAIEFVSMENPYVDYLTRQQASLHDVMLAYEMEGKPLARAHGAPVRLVIPEMYGYKNVKWLTGINLVPQAVDGYWEQLGYDRDAWVGHSNGYGT
ncbi:MAG TPA: molybdopterin-dependent oxidoreductase [Gaiellaceae bacterium]|nr:molybdopterin-dependent oxidoreductase [Gaiellaceae bacterium]